MEAGVRKKLPKAHLDSAGISASFGGLLVVFADTLARTVWAPVQLPVGVFTALLGVPVLIALLGRQSNVRA